MASPVAELGSKGLRVDQPKTLNGTRVSVTSFLSSAKNLVENPRYHSSKLGSVMDQGLSLNLSFLIDKTETCIFSWGMMSTTSHREKNALNV